jgi:hypothetical protein
MQLLRFRGPDFRIDDAWISLRIARNLLEHGALTYDLGRAPVEGMTNLLWTLLEVPVLALAPDHAMGVMRALGAGLHLGTVGLAAHLGARLGARDGGTPWIGAAVAGGAVALAGAMAYHAMSGLETSLWSFLFLASLALWRRGGLALGAVLGGLAMTRPEGVAVSAILAAAWGIERWRFRGERHGPAVVAGILLAVIGAMEVFRLVYYGSLVPNTFYAKPPWPANGAAYLGRFALWGLGGLGWAAALPALRRDRVARGLFTLALLFIAATVATGGDWMLGFRRFTLAYLCLALAAAAALARQSAGWWRLLLLPWVGGLLSAALRAEDCREVDLDPLQRLGRMAAATPGVEQVALVDIGYFGWAFPGHILDLVGLTDAHIAREVPGVHLTKWDDGYFFARAPDLVLIVMYSDTPIADPLGAEPEVRQGVEQHATIAMLDSSAYDCHHALPIEGTAWMAVFARRGLHLPEQIWGPGAPKELRVLLTERLQRLRGGV